MLCIEPNTQQILLYQEIIKVPGTWGSFSSPPFLNKTKSSITFETHETVSETSRPSGTGGVLCVVPGTVTIFSFVTLWKGKRNHTLVSARIKRNEFLDRSNTTDFCNNYSWRLMSKLWIHTWTENHHCNRTLTRRVVSWNP